MATWPVQGLLPYDAALKAYLDDPTNVTPHVASKVTDFAEAVDDRVAALVTAGANITVTYNDAANTLTIAGTGGGGGVSSVNGQTGVVTLAAGDVGAQPLDSDLTAIAALTTTSYGRALLALADQAALMGLVAAASETASGKIEIATQTETNTGTDDTRAITPLKFQTRLAAYAQPLDSDLTSIASLSTTSYGRAFLALADQAALMALIQQSSTTVAGKVELATSGEATTGTDTTLAVTPAGVAAAITARLGSRPIRFSASTPETGPTGDDRAYIARTIAEAHLRVSAAPVGSALTVEVQTSSDRSTWTTQDTLTIAAGASGSGLLDDTTGLSVAQASGDYLRLNVTSVGSTTPAADAVVDVVVT